MRKLKVRFAAMLMVSLMLFTALPVSASEINDYAQPQEMLISAEEEQEYSILMESLDVINDFFQQNNNFLIGFGETSETILYTKSGHEVIVELSLLPVVTDTGLIGGRSQNHTLGVGRWSVTLHFSVPSLLFFADGLITHALTFDVTHFEGNWARLRGVSCSLFATPPAFYALNGSGSSIIYDAPGNVQSRGFATYSMAVMNVTVNTMVAVMPWTNGQVNVQGWTF